MSEHARLDAFESGLTEEGMLAQQLQMKPAIGKSFEHVRLLDKKDVYAEPKSTPVASVQRMISSRVWRWMTG